MSSNEEGNTLSTEEFISQFSDGERSIFDDTPEEEASGEENVEHEPEEAIETESEDEGGEEASNNTEEESDEEEETPEEEEQEEDTTDDGELAELRGTVETLTEEKSNLNKALHSERERRKSLEAAAQSGEFYKKQLEAVKSKIDELDLSDVITIEDQKEIDPRIAELLEAQEETKKQREYQATIVDMQSQVAKKVSKYTNIDKSSSEQGQVLAQMILANVNHGVDMDSAVDGALKSLNGLLSNVTKVAKKTRKPAVKPRTKQTKAAMRPKVKKSPAKKAIADGDFRSLFDKLGAEMAGEN